MAFKKTEPRFGTEYVIALDRPAFALQICSRIKRLSSVKEIV